MDFRPSTVKACGRPMLARWTSFLLIRGVLVDQKKGKHTTKCVIDVSYRERHMACDPKAHTLQDVGHVEPPKRQELSQDGSNQFRNEEDPRQQ